MTPQQWQRIQQILDEALRTEPHRRADLLQRACAGNERLRGEVDALVRCAEATDSVFDRSHIALQTPSGEPDQPRRIGAYDLVRRLGQGGMGVVYLATRTDDVYHKPVALKVLQVGLETDETVRRFKREREILAQLEHPSISRLLDGGTTEDGRPYLVMEHVEGMPIDRYCDAACWSVEQKLALFERVCLAIHFAHQHLIVHRDLKPANILVTGEGEPKLLDFGIAKLLGAENFPLTLLTTAPGQTPMTPAYASPEQMQGDRITTASDVYSLGVLLYRVLTGRAPHDFERRTPVEVQRMVCCDVPSRPSLAAPRQLARQLTGDLDNIVLMALRKEPARRYSSAEQLARDLERHRAGLPVRARRDTLAYRASKFVGRHRLAVASVSTVFVLLMTLLAVLLNQRREILQQRNSLEVTSDFLTGLFENPDPTHARGSDLSARELLERGAAAIERDLAGQPAAQADLMSTMARSFRALGLFREAEEISRKTLSLRRLHDPSDESRIADSLHELAWVLAEEGQLDEAERLARQAFDIRRDAFAAPHPDLLDSVHVLGSILRRQGRFDAAEPLLLAARDMALALDSNEQAQVLASLATLRRMQGRYRPAEDLLQQAIEMRVGELGEDHIQVADLTAQLASLLYLESRFEEAEGLYRDALEIIARVFDGPHPQRVRARGDLAQVLHAQGRYREAETAFVEALTMGREVYGDAHPVQASYQAKLAAVYDDLGRRDEAEKLARQALAIRRQLLGDEHRDVAVSYDYLAVILNRQGRTDEAEALFEKALRIYRRVFDGVHPLLATALANYAGLKAARGEADVAHEIYAQALDMLRAVHDPDHLQVVQTTYNLAHHLHENKAFDAARRRYLEAETAAREALRPGHPLLGFVLTHLGRLQADLGELRDAEASAREAGEILAADFPDGHGRRLTADLVLARALLGQRRLDEAAALLRPQFDAFLVELGRDSKKTRAVGEQLIEIYAAAGRAAAGERIRRQLAAD